MDDPFSNLMQRYSGEAEIEKQREERAARRQRIRASISKWFVRLAIVAMLGAGFYYAKPIKNQLATVSAKFFPAKPMLSPDQMAKVNAVSDAAAKRDRAISDAMR
jgi:hypothetical protein